MHERQPVQEGQRPPRRGVELGAVGDVYPGSLRGAEALGQGCHAAGADGEHGVGVLAYGGAQPLLGHLVEPLLAVEEQALVFEDHR